MPAILNITANTNMANNVLQPHATEISSWFIILPVLIPIVTAAIILMAREKVRYHPLMCYIALALTFISELLLLDTVWRQGPQSLTMSNWLAPFGITFTADLFGVILALFAMLSTIAVAIYATEEFDQSERKYGFYSLLMFLIGGINGAFLTGDIFNLYVWFEVTLIASFGLMVIGSGKSGIAGALKYCLLNLLATTLFLVATGLLYGIIGTLNMADIISVARQSPHQDQLFAVLMLYLLAFGIKAGVAPAHFWLPASYHTPRIVVSALFAGLLTKVGIYALIRTFILLLPLSRGSANGDVFFTNLITAIAILTMIIGSLGALAQNNIRKMINFLVITGIGIAVAGIAVSSHESLNGSIFYLINSILTMTCVNLLVGIVIYIKGASHLNTLGGIYRSQPVLSYIFLIVIFAIIGLPPLSGYWPKIMLVNAALADKFYWLALTILLTSFLNMLCLGRLWLYVFWRDQPNIIGDNKRPDVKMSKKHLTSVVILTAAIIVIGIFPETLFKISGKASYNLLNEQAYIRSVFPPAPEPNTEPNTEPSTIEEIDDESAIRNSSETEKTTSVDKEPDAKTPATNPNARTNAIESIEL